MASAGTMINTPGLSSLVLSAIISVLSVRATPLEPRESITPLSNAQIASFTPYTHFASTAYCQPKTTLTWSCGGKCVVNINLNRLTRKLSPKANCNANPDFIPVASGGDGGSVQFCTGINACVRTAPDDCQGMLGSRHR